MSLRRDELVCSLWEPDSPVRELRGPHLDAEEPAPPPPPKPRPDRVPNDERGRLAREARERTGLTQRELAAAIGVSRVLVSQWECGRSSPSLQHTEAIAALDFGAQAAARVAGATETRAWVLETLRTHGPMAHAELRSRAARADIRSTAASHALDRLVQNGAVRMVDCGDRRDGRPRFLYEVKR